MYQVRSLQCCIMGAVGASRALPHLFSSNYWYAWYAQNKEAANCSERTGFLVLLAHLNSEDVHRGGLLRNHKNRSKSSKQAASEDTEYRDRVGRRSKRQDQTSAMISSVTACVTRTAKAKIHHTHQKLRLRREDQNIEGLGLDNFHSQ